MIMSVCTQLHKDVRIQGGEGPVRTFCGQRVFYRCGRPHFFGAKNFGFFEIFSVSARTGGEGQFFAILCGRHLWTASYYTFVL